MAGLTNNLCEICEINKSNDNNSLDKLDLQFFLKVVLEIPRDYHLLSGIDPLSHQLKSCDQCFNTIHQLKVIYSQITKLTEKFREIQKTFIPSFCTTPQNKPVSEPEPSSPIGNDNWITQVKKAVTERDYGGFTHPFSISREFENLDLSSSPQPQNELSEQLINCAIKIELEESLDETNYDDQVSQSVEDLNTFFENNLKEEPTSADEECDDNHDLQDNPFNSPPAKKAKTQNRPISSKPIRKKDPKKPEPKPVKKFKPHLRSRKPSQFEISHPAYPKLVRNSKGKYFCPETSCTKMYSNKVDIELHILSLHLNEATYKCTFPKCEKILSCSKSLQMHMDRHNKTPRYKCTEDPKKCKRMFYSTIELNRHRQHAHASDFPCNICGKKFACQDYVNIHKLNMHKSQLSFECGYCQRLFQMKSTLDRHVNLVHETTKGKWGCEFCECRFNMKIHLKSHLWRKHSYSMDGYVEDKKVYREDAKCPVKGCRESQSSVESLKSHMIRKHPGLKGEVGEDGLLVQDRETMKFKCNYCDKRYHHQYRLDIHHQAHENKERKPFRCDVCGNGFATVFGLKRHLKRNHDAGEMKKKVEK